MLVELTPQLIVIMESRRTELDSPTLQSSLALPIHHFFHSSEEYLWWTGCRPSIDCSCLDEIGTNESLALRSAESRRKGWHLNCEQSVCDDENKDTQEFSLYWEGILKRNDGGNECEVLERNRLQSELLFFFFDFVKLCRYALLMYIVYQLHKRNSNLSLGCRSEVSIFKDLISAFTSS